MTNTIKQPMKETDTDYKIKTLTARAAILAKPLHEEKITGEILFGLGFLLSDEPYFIDETYVLEVLQLMDLTPLPCTPPFILGIINVRGRILSVINLKNFLNLPEKGITNLNRVIVVKKGEIEIGLLVDEVTENVEIDLDELQTNLSILEPSQREYVIGISKNREVILDIAKFLDDEKIIINEEVKE
ncbi:MAG: chemotaxis protein CheW [Prolixibacteraceae bacterium]